MKHAFRPTAELALPGDGVPFSGDFADRWGWLHPNREWRNLGLSPQFDMTNVRDFTGIVTMHPEPFAAGFKSSLLVFYSKDQKIVFTSADSASA